jgi:hypothetical protein
MSATTVQAEPNATLHVCKRESSLIAATSCRIFVSSSCIGRGMLTYTFPFNALNRKKSGGGRSGDLGGHKSFEIIRLQKNF